LKLLIDENISPEITKNLRTLGYNVSSARESCKGCPDEEIVEIAKKKKELLSRLTLILVSFTVILEQVQ